MTNFEKFRENMTAEMFVDLISSTYVCPMCPALKMCNVRDDDMATCIDTLRNWADMEVKENADD